MYNIVVCFSRRGKCIQRAFDTPQKCIKYIQRWIGKIKDYQCFPNHYTNADLIKIEVENNSHINVLAPLGWGAKIEEVILL